MALICVQADQVLSRSTADYSAPPWAVGPAVAGRGTAVALADDGLESQSAGPTLIPLVMPSRLARN